MGDVGAEGINDLFGNILGKRKFTQSPQETKVPSIGSVEPGCFEDSLDWEFTSEGGKKHRRLIQNRKSAQKCRIKKKIEFEKLKVICAELKIYNQNLKTQLNNSILLLVDELKTNDEYHKKMEAIFVQ